ncbi:Lipid transfer protein [Zostera marina]|uniref:Lipid transfer protein n=1 Tax=Zostera marina TaxID=29655 RepID=A0A0K9Q127_ZOSMR|nr:Lipid transfer protein [Zostera marina]
MDHSKTSPKIVFLLLCLVIATPYTTSTFYNFDFGCYNTIVSIAPCFNYLIGRNRTATTPSGRCCQSVIRLNGTLSSTATRRAACNCFKQVVIFYRQELIDAIPTVCNTTLPFIPNPTINCTASVS